MEDQCEGVKDVKHEAPSGLTRCINCNSRNLVQVDHNFPVRNPALSMIAVDFECEDCGHQLVRFYVYAYTESYGKGEDENGP